VDEAPAFSQPCGSPARKGCLFMPSLLSSWIPWGVDVIVAIQTATGHLLDPLFRAITFLGEQYAFLVLLPCLFWCLDKRQGLRTALLLLFSAYLNSGLKQVFQVPRPFLVSSAVQSKVTATGYAFPSGHAQLAATLWPWLALVSRKRWMALVAVALVLLISFSRVYLGVHYPQDIVVGIVVGLILVLTYSRLQPHLDAWLGACRLGPGLVGAIALPMATLLLIRTDDALMTAPCLAGLGTGYLLERRWIDFRSSPGFAPAAGRLAVGLMALGGVFCGLKALLPTEGLPALVAVFRGLRYACVGFAATLPIPWLFVHFDLATAQAPNAAPHRISE